jgi:recombinational DNA repair protein RecT
MVENAIALFEQRLESEKQSILDRLPKLNEWLTPDRWWTVCYELSRRGKLLAVARENPDSLIDALKKLASWGLEPDGDEAFINVYNEKQIVNGKETWLPTASAEGMYKGLIRRAVEAGVIAHAVSEVIREGDSIEEFTDLKGRHLVHKRAFNSKPNRKFIGAYCLFWLTNGLMDFELFDTDDIESVKTASLRLAQRGNKDAKLSPAWQFSPGEMAKKSVLKRGLKRMRGKRGNPEALATYQDMLDSTRHSFDAETTATEEVELPPDSRPDGHLVKDGVVQSEPPLRLVPDVALTDAETTVIIKALKAAKVRISDFGEWYRATLDGDSKIDDVSDLTASQVAPVLKALEQC